VRYATCGSCSMDCMHLLRDAGPRAAAALAAICLAAACSSTPAATSPAGHDTGGDAASRSVTSITRTSPVSPAVPTRMAATPAASAVSVPAAAQVNITKVRTADGTIVTVAIFRGPVLYVLHNGSADPGAAAARLVHAGPAVASAERGRLLAAFNGGFELSAGAGGYEQEGHVISPLHSGLASLVIDRSGQARIGVWDHSVPAAGETVYSVRQNLQPLVERGRPTPAAADSGLWGATLGGGEYVARSALGQDASGNLIYAASMSATPADLARALVRAGARIAMELDINPEWVQLDVARKPGGPLTAAVPGQNRPADQYLLGWTRDFITALAPPAAPQATALPITRQMQP
jgi:hypothetical protein